MHKAFLISTNNSDQNILRSLALNKKTLLYDLVYIYPILTKYKLNFKVLVIKLKLSLQIVIFMPILQEKTQNSSKKSEDLL